MGCVYVLRNGSENVFKIGRTRLPLERTIKHLSRGNTLQLIEFARIETDDVVACETFLHQRLRSKRIVKGGGTEFFEISPSELAQALHDAEEFVNEFLKAKQQADELSNIEEDSTSRFMAPSAADLAIYSKLLQVREAQDRLNVQRQFFESKLKISIGTSGGLEGLATWKGRWQQHFDVVAFREAERDLYTRLFSRFGSETYRRTFLIQRFT
jgi:hypothetical protein